MTARPEGDFDDVIAFAWDGPAGSVADAARLLLLDSLGCMIAGLGHATPRRGNRRRIGRHINAIDAHQAVKGAEVLDRRQVVVAGPADQLDPAP